MDTTTDTDPTSGGVIGVAVSAFVVFVVMVIIMLCCSCNRGMLRSYAYSVGILRHNPRTQQTTATYDTTSRITYPAQPHPQDGTCDDAFQYGVGDSENQKYEHSSGPSYDVPAPSYESIFGPNEVIIPSCPPEEISNRTVPSSYKT
ncbi:uncharacterized protein LOC125655230 isoform X2 [Ostrea edulis]|uniref:uncharacterized protein LOC125655230 isoform X2 n=1 Tax=Ostrea edulis TaxID=37623 RepID=UPI0020947DD6|nr:uncharacterized protein LOC125655230 isoform X2 [Ostrea edulis]